MRTSLPAVRLTAGAFALALSCARPVSSPADLLLRGGTVVDGSGAAARRADVWIGGDRILAVGPAPLAARRTIDVTGLVVTPGFIDIHSHADLVLLADLPTQRQLLEAKIRQGVTTLIVGNCGLGVAPADETSASLLAAVNAWMTPEGVRAGALDTAAYLERLEHAGVVLNVGTLVPHGPVRMSVMGLAPGAPDAGALERMGTLVESGLRAGAYGLSVGLIYPPGMYSATDELVELARPVAAHGGLFTAHVRGSSETLLQATAELIEVARRSGARVHHSHLEAVGRPFWDRIAQVLALEDEARAQGLQLSHDVFPYTRAATMMSAIFPPWALAGGVDDLLRRLADPRDRERIRTDIAQHVPTWPPWKEGGWPHNLVEAVGWDGIVLASVAPGNGNPWIGRTVQEIADAQGGSPFDTVAELMRTQHGQVGQQVDEISGIDGEIEGLLAILAHPAAAVISDAEDYGRGRPHPAHAGAFARALRLSRERRLLPLEQIVHRMTGYPAALLGLTDRGLLRAGAAADLVIFDAEKIEDRATWDDPRLAAEGIRLVILGGHPVIDGSRYDVGHHGRVLRAGREAALP